MNYLVMLLLLFSGPGWHLLTSVRTRNEAVAVGMAAYARGDAAQAAAAFTDALHATARPVPDPRLLLNLGHAQARAGAPDAAQATYARLLAHGPARLSSVARQQLAVLLAQRGEIAQALSQLRQALLLDPHNMAARFDYEVLSDYLAQRPHRPRIQAPPKAPAPNQPKPADGEKGQNDQRQPAEKAGTDRKGETTDSKPAPTPPTTRPQAQPDPAGAPDSRQPSAAAGNAARDGQTGGTGAPQPVASGEVPGTQRGLDRRSTAAAAGRNGRSNAAGTEAATADDALLQTQRERLKAMNLSPAQARQLLETLRAQEQQYLQQLPRPAATKPDPNQPTW